MTAPTGNSQTFTISPAQVVLGSLAIHYDSTISAVSLVGSPSGNAASNALTVNDTIAGDTIGLNSSGDISWGGPSLQYSQFQLLNVNAAAGSDI